MPLHDWTSQDSWEFVRAVWIVELMRWLKPRLPGDYRADIGSFPAEAVGDSSDKPDVSVRTLFVQRHGFLVAAIELISPRNKDRPSARDNYTARYAGYLVGGVNLLLIDVHPRPVGFSFADAIDAELGFKQPSCPTPLAISYLVGDPAATGGRLLSIWRRPLLVGGPLPPLPLPLTVDLKVIVDLEQTYARAAEDAYLS